MDRSYIFDEINAEREHQDEKWGGPDHDDEHLPNDWVAYLTRYNGRAQQASEDGDPNGYRENLIKIASVAIAAVESHDRVVSSLIDQSEDRNIPF